MAAIPGFEGDFCGLTDKQVAVNLEKYGYNSLEKKKKQPLILKILFIFKEPMFLLLLAAASIYFILGEVKDGGIMLIFVVLIAGIELFQEQKTDHTLSALKEMTSPHVTVLRNESLKPILSEHITVGDIIVLAEGEKVPADALVLAAYDLAADESMLTGEAETVCKSPGNDTEGLFSPGMIYAGTLLTGGTGVAKVTAIGSMSQAGQIGKSIAEAPERPTPLEKQIAHLVKWASIGGGVLLLLVFIFTYFRTNSVVEGILSGVTLAMGIIPEEFPVILTVFLSMGAWRLAKKSALVRRLPSVETLGSVSVLCVDKTGTLTENKMKVTETYWEEGNIDPLAVLTLACEKSTYDPMEAALLAYAKEKGQSVETLFQKKLYHEYSFSSQTKRMGHVWEENGQYLLCAKGSPETILPLCCLSEAECSRIEAKQREMAAHGRRVIALAYVQTDECLGDLEEYCLTFLGLIGLSDPPRKEVADAVQICRQAGIKIAMITGDNPHTAQAIAGQIGMENAGSVLTGAEMDAMDDDDLAKKAAETAIFARVAPPHKTRIVQAFKKNGEIVAMTGDGVNDAAALKYADIGIAMGDRGTAVAKEAADLILLDDNFFTIVQTVEDGRRIFDNIKKAVGYVFAIHVPMIILALMAPFLGIPLLLLPIHIVLLELIIDPTCSIVFERQPAEEGIMRRDPRKKDAHLLEGSLVFRAVVQGMVIGIVTLLAYIYMFQHSDPATARSFGLAVLILSNIFLVYINISSTRSVAESLWMLRKDKVMSVINGGVLLGLLAIVYFPFFNSMAGTHPMSILCFCSALLLAVLATFWWEAVKLARRRKTRA